MSLIDTLKQIILDEAGNFYRFPCPSDYGLEEICGGICEGKFTGICNKSYCWLTAIDKAEREEASADG